MDSSRMDSSKMEFLLKDTSFGLMQEQIIHTHCDCYHCRNNTKPIQDPIPPRETSPKQLYLNSAEAFLFILKKTYGYIGQLFVPDIFFFQEGNLYFTSESGKLRMRDKFTNQDAKKFMEERRKRYLSKIQIKTGISFQQTVSNFSSNDRQGKQKDTPYTLIYRNGTKTFITEAYLNKIIYKRKTDPFWDQVLAFMMVPLSRENPFEYKNFHYVRNSKTEQNMKKIMEKVANDLDGNEESIERDASRQNLNQSTLLPGNQSNLQTFSQIHPTPSINTHSQFLSPDQLRPESLTSSQYPGEFSTVMKNPNQSKMLRPRNVNYERVFEEMIAFIEIATKNRILQIHIEFMEDIEGLPAIMNFPLLITAELLPSQECYLHDRYKPLEPVGIQQLVEEKTRLDQKDEQNLWSVCIAILDSCLEQRKIGLKIENYKKPSKKQLREMFCRFFPEFSPDTMFMNLNWKNELESFMLKSKNEINAKIREDEGISILKRFGIHFYRTFN